MASKNTKQATKAVTKKSATAKATKTSKKVVAKPEVKNAKTPRKSLAEKVAKAFVFPTRKSVEAAKRKKTAYAPEFNWKFALGDIVAHPVHGEGEVWLHLAKGVYEITFATNTVDGESELTEVHEDELKLISKVKPPIAKKEIPENEKWIHEPEAQKKLQRALAHAIANPVSAKPKSVRFDSLPLLARFQDAEQFYTYLKVGNSTAIHLATTGHRDIANGRASIEFDVGSKGKIRVKKTQQVFPVK